MIYMYLLLLHYIADFLCQSHDMALNKSKDKYVLFKHCLIIWAVLSIGTMNILFGTINACLHAIIDWNIWRGYKRNKGKDFKFWEDHWFYATLGADQLMHTSLLILTWSLLNG